MAGANGTSKWATSDLGTAAYVHMKGFKLLGASRASPSGRFIFSFSDPEGRGAELQVEYLNSECRAFDSAVRSLKKLIYDDARPRVSSGRRG